jgi:hypothetical protein
MKASTYRSAAALLFAASLGCGGGPALPTGPATPPVAEAPAEKPKPIVAGVEGEEMPEIAIPVTSTPRPVDPDDPIKGRRSKRAGGHLGAAAHARFWGEHKIIYDQVKSNMMLYMATTGNLDYPKSNEEFMEKVIKGYQMKLPELEPHHEYIYVPEQYDRGLQIRLKPGYNADGSKADGTPADAAAPESAPPGEAPATETPAADPAASAETPAASTSPEPESGRDDAGNPLDLRERAAGFGGVSPTDGLAD